MKKHKGGPGSGRRPGDGTHNDVRVPGHGRTQIGGRGRPIGVRPSAAYPYGRNPDGTPRTANDVRARKEQYSAWRKKSE